MTWHLLVDGRRHTVEILRRGSRCVAVLDGRSCDVDLVESGAHVSLLLGSRSYELVVERRGSSTLVLVNGSRFAVSIEHPGAGRTPRGGVPRSGTARVTAPMPGRVVKVLAAPGDHVRSRQGLVLMEAMKMENELCAPGAGTVREVHVRAGDSVEGATLLLTVELDGPA